MSEALPSEAARCPGCGSEVAPALLACPVCRRLTHADALEALAAEARTAEARGEIGEALGAWRRAHALLPSQARQAAAVGEQIDRLGLALEASGGASTESEPERSLIVRSRSILGTLAALGLLLWKGKFLLGFVATKGKLLLLGLTKSSTLFSMLLSAGVYWTVWGWGFAIGLVLMIYVHEIGHVAALRRLGIPASAPMFVPGLGALVRMHQYPASPREDARVGLAGPIWGLVAAAASLAAGFAFELPLLAAVGRFAAWINLFNLLPVWQLDGARGFRALSGRQRWICVAAMGGMWAATEESLLVLLALGAIFFAATQAPHRGGDRTAFAQMLGLVVVGALLAAIPVATP